MITTQKIRYLIVVLTPIGNPPNVYQKRKQYDYYVLCWNHLFRIRLNGVSTYRSYDNLGDKVQNIHE